MSGAGAMPERSHDNRARSTGSPRATTNPIAASTSAISEGYPCLMKSRGNAGSAEGSVDRKRGVDVADPRDDPTLDVYRVPEPGRLDRRERLGRPYAGLAVQHDLLV